MVPRHVHLRRYPLPCNGAPTGYLTKFQSTGKEGGRRLSWKEPPPLRQTHKDWGEAAS